MVCVDNTPLGFETHSVPWKLWPFANQHPFVGGNNQRCQGCSLVNNTRLMQCSILGKVNIQAKRGAIERLYVSEQQGVTIVRKLFVDMQLCKGVKTRSKEPQVLLYINLACCFSSK